MLGHIITLVLIALFAWFGYRMLARHETFDQAKDALVAILAVIVAGIMHAFNVGGTP